MQTQTPSIDATQLTLRGLCPVQPLDRVKFTPFDQSGLKAQVEGTVFNTQDTSGGNWRIRIVKAGHSFPYGLDCNVYSHEGSFEVTGQLNPNIYPAYA
ncbi:hypothetical protein [Pseudomonas sp. NPDC089569]|uniref:hypothetical protein n=1 Tax=Pseudomonas sp. NPDC089569 TaxID=3390722 RepID=UPI003CFD9F0D